MTEDLATAMRRSWSEIDRLRAFIRSLEWSCFAVLDYDGAGAKCCPSCGGIKPGEPEFRDSPPTPGHSDTCKLIAALAPPNEGGDHE